MRKKLILDYKAPRYKPDSKQIFTTQFFKKFFKKHPEYKELGKKYTIQEKKEFIKFFNECLGDIAIANRDGVMFPQGLGHIYLGSIKTKIKVNNKVSNELGYNVNHTNHHSDGKLLKITYSARPKNYNFENKDLWSFIKAHSFKEKASKAFKDNWNRYRALDDLRKIDDRQFSFYKRENVDQDYIIKQRNRNKK